MQLRTQANDPPSPPPPYLTSAAVADFVHGSW
jgi:hypothetical protein